MCHKARHGCENGRYIYVTNPSLAAFARKGNKLDFTIHLSTSGARHDLFEVPMRLATEPLRRTDGATIGCGDDWGANFYPNPVTPVP